MPGPGQNEYLPTSPRATQASLCAGYTAWLSEIMLLVNMELLACFAFVEVAVKRVTTNFLSLNAVADCRVFIDIK